MNDKKVDAAIAAYQKLGKYASTRARMGAALTAAEQAEPTPAARSGAVKVKALHWEKGVVDWARPIPGVKYVACSTTPEGSWAWWLDGDNGSKGVMPSEAEAKAAAQADYEQRILAALEPAEPATDASHEEELKKIIFTILCYLDISNPDAIQFAKEALEALGAPKEYLNANRQRD